MTRALAALALASGAAWAAPAPGDVVAPFSLPDAAGHTVVWRPGRTTVLSFCAFWCDTWKEQNRRLSDARRAMAGLPADWLTISVDGRWAERAPDRTVLLDRGGTLTARLGIRAVPYTIVVGPDGRVVTAGQGIARGGAVRRAVALAAERGRAPSGPVYLTFDDFPSNPEQDDRLLDALRAVGAPATFFCVGRSAAVHPEAVRRALREGHGIECHGWEHDAARPDLPRCVRALEALGAHPSLYRPPGSEAVRRLSGEAVPAVTVSPYDFSRPGAEELARRIRLAAKPGAVILLHAGVEDTIEALPAILAGLGSAGLRPDRYAP